MKREQTGYYSLVSTVGQEKVKAFVPNPLPPTPPIALDENLQTLMEQALLALGRLDSVSTLLPDIALFLYMYVRKEAVLSSQIEGTQSSLSDLLLYESQETPGVPLDDVREISQYIAALEHGLSRIEKGFPLSLRLIREMHGVLLNKGRGSAKALGEFRRTQNWIGGSRPGDAVFVPPPPDTVIECMGALEKFFHDDPVKAPVLLKAGMIHVQFETIHPFIDGNGRLGRLLITLSLCEDQVLTQPLLYLSLFFKKNRQTYYDLLQKVRLDGDWESWLVFFLRGVRETADSAVQTAKRLVELFERDRAQIQTIGKGAGSALRVHHALQSKPITSINRLTKATKLSTPTVTAAIQSLIRLKIVREITGSKRGRQFSYIQYIKILAEGTEQD